MEIFDPPYSYKEGSARIIRLIAFDERGQILALKKEGYIDIIRGRQTFDDDTHEDAVRREAKEQASISLSEISLVAKIQLPEWSNSKPLYELVFTGLINESGLCSSMCDCNTIYLTPAAFLKNCNRDSVEEARILLQMALQVHERPSGLGIGKKTKICISEKRFAVPEV